MSNLQFLPKTDTMEILMDFKIKIENFEGPIDALLQMIERRKMAINDITLADIADEYIRFIKDLDYGSLSSVTHFVFVASTLTLIKSKSLLPNLDLTAEEEGDIENLKRRIALFKIYQDAAGGLKKAFNNQPQFYHPRPPKREIIFTPDPKLSSDILFEALGGVFNEIPTQAPTKKEATIRIAVHIEDMMDSLEARMKKALVTDFDSFISEKLGGKTEPKAVRVYKVVGFLAMLELVKNGAIHILQKHNFDQIMIEPEKETMLS